MTRIIAGRAKGMRLTTPKSGTRPTSDRVREALFSALITWFGTTDKPAEQQLEGVAVLDLYAGTGAVALEAASRGAEPVVAVDSHTAVLIAANARKAGLSLDVRGANVAGMIPPGPWDVVFVDPPYEARSEVLDRILKPLFAPGRLKPQALVIIERSKRSDPPAWPGGLDDSWVRHYGETTLYFAATKPAGET